MNHFFNLVSVVLIIVPSVIRGQFHFSDGNGDFAVNITFEGINDVVQGLLNSAIAQVQNPQTSFKQPDLPQVHTVITITDANGHSDRHVVNVLWPSYNGQSKPVPSKTGGGDGAFSNAENYGSSPDDDEISFERDDYAICTRCDDAASECEIVDQPQEGNLLLRTRNCKEEGNTLSTVSRQVQNKDGIKEVVRRMVEID